MNLPTDNLYKFMAAAGIVMTITGWIAPYYLQLEYLKANQAYVAAKTDAELARLRFLQELLTYSTKFADEVNRPINDLENQIDEETSPQRKRVLRARRDQMAADVEKRRKESREKTQTFKDNIDRSKKEIEAVHEGQGKLVEQYLTILETARLAKWAFIGFGALFMIAGFWLWYRQVQKHLDSQLRNSKLTVPAAGGSADN